MLYPLSYHILSVRGIRTLDQQDGGKQIKRAAYQPIGGHYGAIQKLSSGLNYLFLPSLWQDSNLHALDNTLPYFASPRGISVL